MEISEEIIPRVDQVFGFVKKEIMGLIKSTILLNT